MIEKEIVGVHSCKLTDEGENHRCPFLFGIIIEPWMNNKTVWFCSYLKRELKEEDFFSYGIHILPDFCPLREKKILIKKSKNII